jgi:predicted nucleic acid-binding protein
MIVIDASALVDMIMGWRSERIRERLRAAAELHAPVTIDAELLHALRKHAFAGVVGIDHANTALDLLAGPALTRHPVQPLARRMWSLRRNITAYDAAYVALAESLELPLITRDRRLARSSGHAARIEYIA